MFRLAHLSDIHLGPLPELSLRELATKRITGYINWQRNRKRAMFGDTLISLVGDMKEQKPDHVCVTGDLVNLATRKEIEGAREWLEDLGPPDHVSVVPGNHDAYVPGALDRAWREWNPYLLGDRYRKGMRRFPYLRVRDGVAIIGVSSAEATVPFFATGSFQRNQALATARLLRQADVKGLFRVVMIHHPPISGAAAWSKRLIGKQLFSKVVRDVGAELVLHGHTHLDTLHWLTGPRGEKVPVVGVPSASQAPGDPEKPAARYNLFEIEGERGSWTLRQRERGERSDGSGIGWVRERSILFDGRAVAIAREDRPEARAAS